MLRHAVILQQVIQACHDSRRNIHGAVDNDWQEKGENAPDDGWPLPRLPSGAKYRGEGGSYPSRASPRKSRLIMVHPSWKRQTYALVGRASL